MRHRRAALLATLAPALLALGASGPPAALTDPAAWEAAPAEGVELHLAATTGPAGGPALRLDWDFHGHGGWAAARHPLDLVLPPSWELRFALRGSGPANKLEVKLIDPSGENVWWHVRPAAGWPEDWTPVRIRKRQVSFAWGPVGGGEPERLGALELAVTAGDGGRGSLEIAGLELVPTEPPRPPAGPPTAAASSAAAGHPAVAALDADPATAWRPAGDGAAALTVDLRGDVELGGLTLRWEPGRAPSAYGVELSRDGTSWETARPPDPAGAPESHLPLPDAEAHWIRLTLPAGACADGCGLAELVVRPLAFGRSPNDLFAALAAEAPRGAYPRGFSGEAVYWTVVGVDGDPEEVLFSEDGAVGLGTERPALEPFLSTGGRLWSWADVDVDRTLLDGDLPLPEAAWRLPGARLEIAPVATGRSGASTLRVRYRVVNSGADRLRGRLLLAVRPFQVDPPVQFLNLAGGVAADPAARLRRRPAGGRRHPAGRGVAGRRRLRRRRLRARPAPRRAARRSRAGGGGRGRPHRLRRRRPRLGPRPRRRGTRPR